MTPYYILKSVKGYIANAYGESLEITPMIQEAYIFDSKEEVGTFMETCAEDLYDVTPIIMEEVVLL